MSLLFFNSYIFRRSSIGNGSGGGGTVTSYAIGSNVYMVHTFTSSNSFTVSSFPMSADVLIVAGGGGAGFDSSSGAGAGGYLLYSSELGGNAGPSLQISTGSYFISVGTGGIGGSFGISPSNGGNSSAFGNTAIGGGSSAGNSGGGSSGGSGGGGGGGGASGPGYPGTPGQGNAGGASTTAPGDRTHGGGGGAGSVGSDGGLFGSGIGGNGGIGLQNSITGTAIYYAGGGGGNGLSSGGTGGLGGGGNGGSGVTPGGNGTNGLGGGGGGSLPGGGNGGRGGDGVVILRYLRNPVFSTFARIVDGTSVDVAQSVTCDSRGNVYFSGYYNGTATIKDQAGNTLGTLPASLGSSVGFVCKFNSSGTYQYSITIDAASPGNDNSISVTCDSNENMYVAGVYNGTIATIYRINSSSIVTTIGTLPASSDWACFTSKFDSSGVYLYTRIIDGNAVGTGGDGGQSVTCDSTGSVYFAGYYRGTGASIRAVNSSNVSVTVGVLPSVGGAAAFVSKFDSSGTYQYTRLVDSGGTDLFGCVTCDSSGNMYSSGYYEGTPIIYTVSSSNTSTAVATLRASSGGGTAFACKFNSSGTYQYGITIDSVSTESTQGIKCDSLGNTYLAIQYSSTPTIYFNSSSNAVTTIDTLPASIGDRDSALCKFDSNGTYQYSRLLGSTGTDVPANTLGIDQSDNVYIGGYYTGTPTIRNQSGTTLGTLPASSNESAFLLKFTSGGKYEYARLVDSVGVTEVANGVTCDSNGNVYFSGYYTGTPTIRDQAGNSLGTLPASLGSTVAFMSKFDPNGNYSPIITPDTTSTFARIVDSTGSDYANSVACDSEGNVYLAGYYNGTPTIRDQAGNSLGTLPASSGQSAFVSKFNSFGTYQYSRIIDSAGTDFANYVACDSSGNLYLAGSYNGTPTIRDQAGNSLGTLPASTFTAAYMCKFNSAGTYQFSRIIEAGGSAGDESYGVCIDSSGSIYISGYYTGTATIIDQAGNSLGTLPASSGQSSGFLCKFNSAGTYQYSRLLFGSAGIGNRHFYISTVDSSDSVYVSGYYDSTSTITDQSGTTLSTLPSSLGFNAGLICKFNSTGTFQYARIVDSTSFENSLSVKCDSAQNVYMLGQYYGTPSIRDQAGTSLGTLPASAGQGAGYMCKFSSTGTYQYSRIINGVNNDSALEASIDSSGSVYLAGYYNGTPTIIDQAGTSLGTLPASSGQSAFVSKFNSSGTYQYSRIIDSANPDSANSVACDSSGNLYLAGSYNGTGTIRDQAGTSLGTLPATSGSDVAFLIKFNSSGNY